MSTFIKSTSQDYLNVSILPKVRAIPAGVHGAAAARLIDQAKADGAVPLPEAALGDLEAASVPVIPSGPATTVICVSPTGGVTAAVVIGYRVCRTGVEPIYLVEPPEGSTRFMMVGATGLVRLDDGSIYPTLEQAKGAVTGMQPEPVEAKVVEPMPKLAVGGRRHAAR